MQGHALCAKLENIYTFVTLARYKKMPPDPYWVQRHAGRKPNKGHGTLDIRKLKMTLHPVIGCNVTLLVPVVGLEPTRGRPQWILNPSRLPFHHTGK